MGNVPTDDLVKNAMVKAGNMALKRRTGEILKNVKKAGKITDPCTTLAKITQLK